MILGSTHFTNGYGLARWRLLVLPKDKSVKHRRMRVTKGVVLLIALLGLSGCAGWGDGESG